MLKINKPIKCLIFLIIAVSLLVNLLYWLYPQIYLSYNTGYGIGSISNVLKYHNQGTISDFKNACLNLDPDLLMKSYAGFGNFAELMAKISIVLSYVFLLITWKKLSRKEKYIFIFAPLLIYLIYFWAHSGELELVFYSCLQDF